MKPIKNFRNHPHLKYDALRLIFVISDEYSSKEFKSKLYLLDEEVKQITPISIDYTNLGDPYKELARLYFLIDNKEDSMDIDIYELKYLINMIKSVEKLIPISKELDKFIKL